MAGCKFTQLSRPKVLITFTNASKEVPASDRHRIFDRFHRGDPARLFAL
jgi:signal transduction histidine kinase